MYIERIEQLEKGRRRLVFETGERLVLYKGEIRSYDLSEGQDIPETLYQELLCDVLGKRATKRAMHPQKSRTGPSTSFVKNCVRTNIRKKQWSRRSPMSRVITISMICVMPAKCPLSEREEEQPQTSAGSTEERGLRKSSSNRHF